MIRYEVGDAGLERLLVRTVSAADGRTDWGLLLLLEQGAPWRAGDTREEPPSVARSRAARPPAGGASPGGRARDAGRRP